MSFFNGFQWCSCTWTDASTLNIWNVTLRGCKGHMCFDCLQKAVFPGNSAQESSCPHCRRAVSNYSYAFFATYKNVSLLQDKLSGFETEVGRMKKHLAVARAEAEQATTRLDEWCRWATAAKSSLQAMPSSSMPHAHVSAPPQRDSETARSRSPRQSQVRLARLEFAPQARVPEYDG